MKRSPVCLHPAPFGRKRDSKRTRPSSVPVLTVLRLGKMSTAALVALFVALFAQTGGKAAVIESELSYAMSFRITGDYVAKGVNLPQAGQPPGQGTITISDVPANADIL